ncbi:MAG: hypothetical protein IKG69_11830 [Atopobiaceae bacterium]|nr:hypothetical protein [Atopobiaceae bacterium]
MRIDVDGGEFNDYATGSIIDGGSFAEPADTALKAMRAFVWRFPYAELFGDLSIDYTDRIPDTAGLFPSGIVEVRRRSDVLGNVTVENQYNFALYTVMSKAPGDDAGATLNAEWVQAFQEWVQDESVMGQAPTFGDEPRKERITAQNGAIYSADPEGVAVYAIQISVSFERHYEKGW